MTKYLVSFPAPAMDVPSEDLPAVSDAARLRPDGPEGRAALAALRQFDPPSTKAPPVR